MITLITEPSLYPWHNLIKGIKNIIKRIIGRPILAYSGHYAVMRSIHAGLKELEIPFNYNPKNPFCFYKHVHVFGNLKALRMAIILKKIGLINRLTVGPNLITLPSDNKLATRSAIDLFLVNSQWTFDLYIHDAPFLKNRIAIWPAGIDYDFWNIEKKQDANQIIIYSKMKEQNFIKECVSFLEEKGENIEIVYYGSYTIAQLKRTLENAKAVVYFVNSESQGIALFEIWASNTPTIVWNPGNFNYNMKNYACSSAPYLSTQTGAFFEDIESFKRLYNEGAFNPNLYQPNEWIKDNGTDKVSAEIFMNKTTNSKKNDK
jgi:hypothetical protein